MNKILFLGVILVVSCTVRDSEKEEDCQSCLEKYSSSIEFDENHLIKNIPNLDLGGISTIGLGESTHGSKSEMEIKTKLLKYLFREHQFEKVFYESNFILFERVNENLLDSTERLKAFKDLNFWTTRTKENYSQIEFISNLKAHNPNVEIYGMDFQNPTFALKKIKEEIPITLDKQIDSMIDLIHKSKGKVNGEHLIYLEQRRNDILKYLEPNINFEKYLQIENYFNWAFQAINLGVLERDSLMTNLILDNSGNTKSIVFGHNEHISKRYKSVGGYLDKSLNYIAVGIVFYEGEYTAWNEKSLKVNIAQKPPQHSIEYYLKKLSKNHLIVNLTSLRKDKFCIDPFKEIKIRTIGAQAKEFQFQEKQILDNFDYLIFIDKSVASVVL
ncbi:MAG: erythromycin esterase family protein [Saprospiraceae bacterium]